MADDEESTHTESDHALVHEAERKEHEALLEKHHSDIMNEVDRLRTDVYDSVNALRKDIEDMGEKLAATAAQAGTAAAATADAVAQEGQVVAAPVAHPEDTEHATGEPVQAVVVPELPAQAPKKRKKGKELLRRIF